MPLIFRMKLLRFLALLIHEASFACRASTTLYTALAADRQNCSHRVGCRSTAGILIHEPWHLNKSIYISPSRMGIEQDLGPSLKW